MDYKELNVEKDLLVVVSIIILILILVIMFLIDILIKALFNVLSYKFDYYIVNEENEAVYKVIP